MGGIVQFRKFILDCFVGSLLTMMVLFSPSVMAHADVLPIQSFKTPVGIDVWLVEDPSSSVVSMIVKFDKTDNKFPYHPSIMLLERTLADGAGILSPLEMSRFAKETPSNFSLAVGFSKTTLTIQTTKEGLAATLNLWSRLIEDPQLEKAHLDHSKSQTIAAFSQDAENLGLLAFLNVLQEIFPDTTFKPDFKNAAQTIKAITAEDLKKEITQQFLNAKPKVMVVGNINQKELTKLLEGSIGKIHFSSSSDTPFPSKPHWHNKELIIHKDVPQSVVTFAQPGLDPHHKDYAKYLLLQEVLYTRMFEELREKRGMIYGIRYSEVRLKDTNLLVGHFSCECTNAPKVAKFIRSEWERLKDFGITQKELSTARLNFKRNKILNLTSATAVAEEYAIPLAFNLAPDVAKTLLEHAEKVTLEEMNHFVQDILKPKFLSFVLIGPSVQPKGKK